MADLAAMRDAIARMGGDAKKINPLLPAELVIDHSVQVDQFGTDMAFAFNAELEFQRNVERYEFLRWGQNALQNFKSCRPTPASCHQVNLEYLARVVCDRAPDGRLAAYPDSLVGTDSHTTMVNGLGVFGWGVGGIEAEAAMLGQPLSMLVPDVVGFKLHGRLPEGATATDLVLTVTEMLRKKGVVGQFVEFYGTGLSNLTLPDRATIANMAPEYGATMGFFPVDAETLAYLRFTGRSAERSRWSRPTQRCRGSSAPTKRPTRSSRTRSNSISPRSSPRWPDPSGRRIACRCARRRASFAKAMEGTAQKHVEVKNNGDRFELSNGSVVIAAITSCTNTSNPSLMLGAGLVAKKAVERGLALEAVGEDEPRARLQSRDGLPESCRPHSLSGKAEVQSGGLRLHHVYRQ